MRDYALGTTFDIKFTSRRFSTGAPFTLAGSPVISAYPDNSVTQLTAGITLSVDFDSVTGLNNVRVVATGGNGYASGSNYALVITTGTVDSVSVVGEVVGEFSLEAQSPLRPTTAGRTVVVDAAGLADANVVKLGPTGSGTAQTARDVGGALPAAAPQAAGGLITSAAGSFDIDEMNVDVESIETRVILALPAAAPQAAGGLITSAAGSLDLDEMNVDIEAIQTGVAAVPTATQNADALLNRDMSAVSDSNARSPLNALRFLRNKRGTAAGTLTVTKEDDTTSAWTAALTTDAAAVPVITVDPA